MIVQLLGRLLELPHARIDAWGWRNHEMLIFSCALFAKQIVLPRKAGISAKVVSASAATVAEVPIGMRIQCFAAPKADVWSCFGELLSSRFVWTRLRHCYEVHAITQEQINAGLPSRQQESIVAHATYPRRLGFL
jgi:hypothetical protein